MNPVDTKIKSGSAIEQAPVITADTLNSSESLLDIPKIEAPTELNEAESSLEAFGLQEEAMIADQSAKTTAARASADEAFKQYVGSLSGEASLEGLQFRAEQEAGLPQLESELNELNAELRGEKKALKDRIDELNKNREGGLASGIDAQIRNAKRDSFSLQADIAITQQAAQGRFDSAMKWAQRKAAIQFGEQQRVIDIRKEILDRNDDLFDKEDRRLYEQTQKKLENDLNKAREDFKTLQTTKIEALKMAQTNGAPTSVLRAIQAADSPEGVLQAGGQYAATDLLERRLRVEQINKIGFDKAMAEARLTLSQRSQDLAEASFDLEKTKEENEIAAQQAREAAGLLTQEQISEIDSSPQGKRIQAMSDFKMKLSIYQNLFNEEGMEFMGADKKRLEVAYTNAKLAFKEAAELGAIQAPDVPLIEGAIANATPGFFGNLGNVMTLGRGTRNVAASLEEAQRAVNSAASINVEQLYSRDPIYQNSQYVQAMLLPFGDELITTDEVGEMDAALSQ